MVNLYVNGTYKEWIDQITVIAEANDQKVSTIICKAVKKYVQNLNDEVELVADNDEWGKFIDNASKEELYKMSKVICSINDRIVRKVCQ
jgi:hypothetical protein